MVEAIVNITRKKKYWRKYYKNIDNIINIAESIINIVESSKNMAESIINMEEIF